jgi:DNA-binding MarR family transcriptional regulator
MPKISTGRVANVTIMRSAEDDGDAFLDAFDAFAAAIRRARGVPARDGDGRVGLTLSQYTLVRALAGRPAARIGDLAGDASVSPSTATRILDALERRAMVRRARLAEDRRGVTVTLTARGQEALDRHDAWLRGRQRAFFSELPEGERSVAADLLVRLSTLIDELSGGPAD